MRTHRRSPMLSGFAILLLVGVQLLAPLPASAQNARQPLDLVAMLLRGDDYLEAGLAPPTFPNAGSCFTADEYAENIAGPRGEDPANVANEMHVAGLLTSCGSVYVIPTDAGFSAPPAMEITSYMHLFADEDGAMDGFAYLEDESSRPEHVDLPDGDGIGDESEATASSGMDAIGPYQSIDVTFRLGNLSGGVTLKDYTGQEPDSDAAFALAETLLGKAEDIIDGDGPSLGTMAIRIEDKFLPPAAVHRYELVEGEAEPFVNETDDEFERRVKRYAGAEYVFLAGQMITGSVSGFADVQFGVYLAQYNSDDEATAFVENAFDFYQDDPDNVDVVEREDVGAYGDASITMTYGTTRDGNVMSMERALVAVDDIVINMYFMGPVVPLGMTDDVIGAQVACVEDGGCTDTVPIPSAFSGDPATPDDENENEDSGRGSRSSSRDEDEDAGSSRSASRERDDEGKDERGRGGYADADGSTFESEEYPYSISFSDDWKMDEPQVIGDMELLSMNNGVSGVVIIVDTAHDGDVASCLDGALAYIADDPDMEDIELMEDEDGEPMEMYDDDVAYAAYSYVTPDGDEMALYAECLTVEPGDVTMEFNQFVALDAYEDEVDAREDLLDGIDID